MLGSLPTSLPYPHAPEEEDNEESEEAVINNRALNKMLDRNDFDDDSSVDSDGELNYSSGSSCECDDQEEVRQHSHELAGGVSASFFSSSRRGLISSPSISSFHCSSQDQNVHDERRGEKSIDPLSTGVDQAIENNAPPLQKPFPKELCTITLTKDHTPYNKSEALLVTKRSNDASRAITPARSGGILRVAGSLSVTRALGDAYLKTDVLSFFPYKGHVPYITALPQVNVRKLKEGDRIVVMATDGVWERVDAKTINKWVTKFFNRPITSPDHVDAKKNKHMDTSTPPSFLSKFSRKRKRCNQSRKGIAALRNQTAAYGLRGHTTLSHSKVSDVIARKVLNKIRRMRKMKSLQSLMAFPAGPARRQKHDDITACVVDLSGFVEF